MLLMKNLSSQSLLYIMIGVNVVVVASKSIHGHLMATSSLQRIVVDTKGLSVTSFKFNEKNKYSSWVDNLLGSKNSACVGENFIHRIANKLFQL